MSCIGHAFTCIRKAFDLIENHHGRKIALADLKPDDPLVYDMLCEGESIGVFQVESRAQMNMLPRLKPRTYYDLVVEVAIVRPGPIQGDMVHPYLKQRGSGKPIAFPSPSPEHGPPGELENILKRTEGVPIFQEQAMQIAMDAAKFTSEEANELRKSMATFRSRGTIHMLEPKFVADDARGYDPVRPTLLRSDWAATWLSRAMYDCTSSVCRLDQMLLSRCSHARRSTQPMGPAPRIVRDARDNGVEVRHPDVNMSMGHYAD